MEALILTAARSGAMEGATLREVDLEAGMWTVPAERMKMSRVHHVPFAPDPIDVFCGAEALRVPGSDLVFRGSGDMKPASPFGLSQLAAEETSYPGEVAEAALAHAFPTSRNGISPHPFR